MNFAGANDGISEGKNFSLPRSLTTEYQIIRYINQADELRGTYAMTFRKEWSENAMSEISDCFRYGDDRLEDHDTSLRS